VAAALLEILFVLNISQTPKFQGVRLGFENYEFGVSVDMLFITLCDVVYNCKDHTFRLLPLFLMKERRQIAEASLARVAHEAAFATACLLPLAFSLKLLF